MLISDFKNLVSTELGRDIETVRGSSIVQDESEAGGSSLGTSDTQLDECALSSVVSGWGTGLKGRGDRGRSWGRGLGKSG